MSSFVKEDDLKLFGWINVEYTQCLSTFAKNSITFERHKF